MNVFQQSGVCLAFLALSHLIARPESPLRLTIAFTPIVHDLPASADEVWIPVSARDGCQARMLDEHWTEMRCSPGYATALDRVLVFEAVTRPIEERVTNLNFSDATWIFDPGADGRAALIIRFKSTGEGLVADLFDDVDGDGEVSWTLHEGVPEILETHYALPTVHVVALGGWWQRDNRVNFNLDLAVDGPVKGMIDYPNYRQRPRVDGQVDLTVHVRDVDGDGRPDYEWRQATPPATGDSDGIYRTAIMVNRHNDESIFVPVTPWPYVGGFRYDLIKDFNVASPPIQMDWAHARIVNLGEFVASRGNPGNFFIYSIRRIEEGKENAPDFENPFCFYDKSEVGDGYPDLTIRLEDYPARDQYFLNGQFDKPLTEVEYTWDLNHDQRWDYEFGLLGRHSVPDLVVLPEFSIRSADCTTLPAWIASNTWDAATFVEVEKDRYWTNEHIYEWTANRGAATLRNLYVTGLASEEPEAEFHDIPEGFRGEYAFRYFRQPQAYFSPIDHKLHLLGAEAGVWNVRQGREVRYESLGGGFIDHWRLRQDDDVIGDLWFAHGELLLSINGALYVRSVAEPAAAFTVAAPTERGEWENMRAMLNQHRASFAGDDLKAMFDQFASPIHTLPAVDVRELHVDQHGFSFVLDAEGDQSSVGKWLPDLAHSGRYLITFSPDHGYQANASPSPTFLLAAPILAQTQPVAGSRTLALIRVTNTSKVSFDGLNVELTAKSPGGGEQIIGQRTLSLAAGEVAEIQLPWKPPAAGEWQLVASMTQPRYSDATSTVLVKQWTATDVWLLTFLAANPTASDFIIAWCIVALVSSAVLPALAYWHMTREAP